ncbi:GlxA family transcriptional regulator [Hydrogenophaga sp. IBVHS2]|uniref:GlxA family transcriptional regulator n=1 Tax=Hydrogenophaga sp. IBVHS2 TaxID=1985170 RepID=UPI000A2E750F|nr:helix-turn-helix domain-containing protein [Hydrogenophaga sp. IBVHS2]OSZ66181.1 AraC family transcriptional regulator [Hydrogenophaga sp. IBVHS2]
MKVHLLVADGVFDLGLAALTDTLSLANAMAGSLPQAPAPIEMTLVAVRRRIRTAQGLTVPVVPARGVSEPDVVLVPAFGDKMPDTLAARLARPDVPDAVAALQEWSTGGAHLGTACSGGFLLAESGLLDGLHATTSWWLGPMFRQRYPNVTLDESRMVVSTTRFTTAGAALAHVDLALRIVRGQSPALAALVARYLLVEARTSQAEFVIPDHLAHADPIVERFECWSRRRLAHGFSLAEAASAAGTSERTLARRLQSVLGKTPLSYFQDLRVEQAVHLLRTGNASVDQVAAQVGYTDGVTLRALLRRKLGRGVRELRRGA